MKLQFIMRRSFGKDRYYPDNPEAWALVDLTGRKCLKDFEIARLKYAGFIVFTRSADSNSGGNNEST